MKTFNILLLGIACAISSLQAMDTGHDTSNYPLFMYNFGEGHPDKNIEKSLAKISKAEWNDVTTEDPFRDHREEGDVCFVKKIVNGEIVGAVLDNNKDGGCWAIVVDRTHEGLRSAILDEMIKYCRETGRPQKNLVAQHRNVSAYLQAGFTVVTPMYDGAWYEYSKPKPIPQPTLQSAPQSISQPVVQPFWKTYQKTIIGSALVLATAGICLKYLWRKAPRLIKYKS